MEQRGQSWLRLLVVVAVHCWESFQGSAWVGDAVLCEHLAVTERSLSQAFLEHGRVLASSGGGPPRSSVFRSVLAYGTFSDGL